MPFALLGATAPPWRALLRPAALPAPAVLTRAQVSSRASGRGADDVTWMDYAADVPRFQGAAQRLLIEGQRSNGIRNPRAEGAVVGGALPTNWGSIIGGGLTLSTVALLSEQGMQGVRIRWAGTATSTQPSMRLETTTAIVAAPSQIWTASYFLRVVSSSGTFAFVHRAFQRDASGASVAAPEGVVFAPTSSLARHEQVWTLTADATTARIVPVIGLAVAIGAVIDITFDVFWPQMELAGFASTPVLPAVGTPAASTRGADLVSLPLASLGVTGPCTMLWRGVMPQAAPVGASQVVMQADTGVDTARWVVINLAGTNTIRLAGSGGLTADLGTMTPGTPFTVGVAADGAGRVAGWMTGGTVQVLNGAPTGLTTLRLGNNASNTAAQFGEVSRLGFLPFAVPDAGLPGLAGTLPL
ncbi:hypothetical protein ACVFYP_04170 [Roseomonas sp. F4]